MYQFVNYGWKELRVNKGVAGFKHPEKPISVVAYNDTPLKNHIPFLTQNTRKWSYAVVDGAKEEVIEEATYRSRNKAYQAIQDNLKQHRLD